MQLRAPCNSSRFPKCAKYYFSEEAYRCKDFKEICVSIVHEKFQCFGNMGFFHFMILVQDCYKLVHKTRITRITSSTFDETEISTTTNINVDTDISTTLDETQSGYIHVHISRLFCCILFLPYTNLSNNCTCYR